MALACRAAASATNRERRRQRKAGELITAVSVVSLSLATKKKLASLHALLREIRSCINGYIAMCWKYPEAALDKPTLDLYQGGSLSYRHRSNALKIALDTINSTIKSAEGLGVRPSRPHYSEDADVPLSSLVCKVEKGKGSFDFVLKISSLVAYQTIVIPVKGHKRLNLWLKRGKLLNSVVISESRACLQINVLLGPMKPVPNPDVPELPGAGILGIDLGYLKLIADSDEMFYGMKMKAVVDRVARTRRGSKGNLRARRARTHYINRQVNELPWTDLAAIGREDLTGIKQGKKPNRGKSFRKKMAPWAVRQAATKVDFMAKVNRVHLVTNNPRGTSRTCPLCGKEAKENRRGEVFRCVRCNYTADSDTVGAMNILVRTRSQLRAVYGRSASSKERG